MLLAIFVLGMFAFVGLGLLAEYLSKEQARRNLLIALSESTGVIVNGEPVRDPSALLAELRRITQAPSHHSSPTRSIHLELTGGDRVVMMILARDSEDSTEFWVYRPGRNWNNDPLGQYAGTIVSRNLDDFMKQLGL